MSVSHVLTAIEHDGSIINMLCRVKCCHHCDVLSPLFVVPSDNLGIEYLLCVSCLAVHHFNLGLKGSIQCAHCLHTIAVSYGTTCSGRFGLWRYALPSDIDHFHSTFATHKCKVQ